MLQKVVIILDKQKVYVTRRLPDKALHMISAECDLEVNPQDRALTRAELEAAVQGIDGLLCLLTDRIDGPLLDLNPNLKVVANYAAGFDNIDVAACTDRGIPVSNTPGVLTDTTADLAWTLLMAVARRVVEGDKFIRAGKFKGWGPMMLLGGDVYRKTIGIIGMGNIGKAVARRASGFDMQVIYYTAHPLSKEEEQKLGIHYKKFDDLIRDADFISLHVPLNLATKHLIGERELEMMKETAYLINTARGPVIDEKALVKALQDKVIAGAGLDVFENEPALASGLDQLDNVVIVPHIASASVETRTKMAVMAAENLLARFRGEMMPNLVNPEALR